MEDIIDKLKARTERNNKNDYISGVRNTKRTVIKKSKMKVGGVGIDCLTKR